MIRPAAGFIPVFFLLLFAPLSAAEAAQKWSVSYNQSALSFTGTQLGVDFTGTIQKYSADILFDLARPENGRVAVDLDMTSLLTGDRDRDRTAATEDWFDFARFPAAQFVADSFVKKQDGAYEGQGTLTLKGVSAPVVLSFRVDLVPDSSPLQARVKGRAVLDRSVFGIGTGEWKSESVIGNQVTVHFDLVAYGSK